MNEVEPPTGKARPVSSRSAPLPTRKRRNRASAGVTFRQGSARKQRYRPRSDYIRTPITYDQDSSDNYTKPFAVRDFLGGYSSKFENLGDGFIYRRDPIHSAMEGCPKVSMAVVDKAISPVEQEMEFGKEEKKTLPAYYYAQASAGKSARNSRKGNTAPRDKRRDSTDTSMDDQTTKREPKTPSFIGDSPWCFASPDKNIQIYFLPPKPNILKFENKESQRDLGYGNYSKSQHYSREPTELSREMSNLTVSSTKTESSPVLPGITHDLPRNSSRYRSGGSRNSRPGSESAYLRLPGKVPPS